MDKRFGSLGLLLTLLALHGTPAQAHVGSGAQCANCHTTARNAMSLTSFQYATNLPGGSLKVYQASPGQTIPIGLQVIDGRNEYGLAMVNLDATGTSDSTHKLLSVPDASWTRRSGYYSLGPKTGNQTWTFRLGIASNTPPDLYLLSIRIAGVGSGRWNEQESFLVEVRRPLPTAPQIQQPAWNGHTFTCRVPTSPGFSYSLETQLNPPDPTWTTLDTLVGDGSIRTLTDPQAISPKALYRVRVE